MHDDHDLPRVAPRQHFRLDHLDIEPPVHPSQRESERAALEATRSEGPSARRRWLRSFAVAAAAFAVGGGAVAGAERAGVLGDGRNGEATTSLPAIDLRGPFGPNSPFVAPLNPAVDESSAGASDGSSSSEPYANAAEILNPSIVQIRHDGSVGSGVVFNDAGLIVTNAHVVGDAEQVSVRVADGRRVAGTVIGIAAPVDIAVVQLDQDLGMPPATLAVGQPLRAGQIVVAMGSPYGFEQSVSAGIVSAVNRPVPSPTGHLVPMIQTDASINPGNSGGALADRTGAVIGLNSSIRTDGGGGSIGIGFAIPIDVAVSVAERLVNGEAFTPGFLGASGVDVVSPVAGVLVTDIGAGGPAFEGGVQEGDIIVGFGTKRIQTAGQLGAKVLVTPPGTSMDVTVVRDGAEQRIAVAVGAGRIVAQPDAAAASEGG